MRKKHCRICGDKAICFNFSVVTCASCKIFFRRHALKQNVPTCTINGKCEIKESTRKNCIACRLEKCLANGMNKNLIYSRNERKTKYQEISPDIIRIYKNSTDLKGHELNRLIEVRVAVSVFNEEETLKIIGDAQNMIEIANLQKNSVSNVIKFCKSLSAFKNVNQTDQLILFKNFFPVRSLIRVAFQYDRQNDGFPVRHSEGKALFVRMDLMKTCLLPNAHSMWRKLFLSLNLEMENDLTVRNLILSLLLFKQRDNLEQMEHIHYHHILYNYLLKRYLEQKYSNIKKANAKYNSLLLILQYIDQAKEELKNFHVGIQKVQNPNKVAQVLKEIYDS